MAEVPKVQAGMSIGITFGFQHEAIIREVVAKFYPVEGERDDKVPITLSTNDPVGANHGYTVALRGHVRGEHAPGKYVCGFIGARTAGGQHLSVKAEDLPEVALEVVPEPDGHLVPTALRFL